jgi:hypothetical protein
MSVSYIQQVGTGGVVNTTTSSTFTYSVNIPNGYYDIYTLVSAINLALYNYYIAGLASFNGTTLKNSYGWPSYYFCPIPGGIGYYSTADFTIFNKISAVGYQVLGTNDNLSTIFYGNPEVLSYYSECSYFDPDEIYGGIINRITYTNFTVVSDSNSYSLLQLLGFNFKSEANYINPALLYHCSGFNYSENNSTPYVFTTSYNNSLVLATVSVAGEGNPLSQSTEVTANFCANLNEITDLNISLGNTISQNRNTYNNLSQSDFLLTVPVSNGFGNNNYFLDNGITVESYNVNLNLSSINIQIYDQIGRLVNFRGVPWTLLLYIRYVENEEVGNAADLTMQNMKLSGFDTLAVKQPYSRNHDTLRPQSIDYIKRTRYNS